MKLSSIFILLPPYMLPHGILAFLHFFGLYYAEISQILPETTTNDFFDLCLQSPSVAYSQISSMDGRSCY